MSQLSEAESTEALMDSSNSDKPYDQSPTADARTKQGTAPSDLGQDLGPHSNEFTEECNRQKLSLQSDGTVPGNEGSPYVARRVFAILTPLLSVIESNSDSRIILKYTPDLENFLSELQNLITLSRNNHQLWLCHQLLMDQGHNPIIDGRLVSENSLYSTLCNGAFSSVCVFLLALPIDCKLKEFHEATVRLSNSKEGRCTRVIGYEDADSCDFCVDVHFYLFVVKNKEAWRHVLNATTQVLSRAATEAKLTPDEVARELTRSCPSLKLLQKSGIPSGRCLAETCMPECLDIDTGAPDEHRDEVDQIFSKSPIQPSEELCNFEISLKSRRYRRFNDMALRQSDSISVTIESYKDEAMYRSGASYDHELIHKISKRFTCDDRDIHQFFSKDLVATDDIDKFIESVVLKRRNKVHRLFLFIASHGSQAGLLTSVEETIQLGKLLEPVLSLAEHVTLIYQPCRGLMKHSRICSPNAISLCGVSLSSADTAGSCLPIRMLSCSALFACMPQYASYHSDAGSLMLLALNEVVQQFELGGKSVYLSELAQMTQRCLKKCFSEWTTQVQYTDRSNCGIQISENAPELVKRFTQEPRIPWC